MSSRRCLLISLVVVAVGFVAASAAGAAAWTSVKVPKPYRLDSVSCRSSRWCEATGHGRNDPVLAHWDGSRWRIERNYPKHVRFARFACASTRSCMAVGGFTGSSKLASAYWNGSRWTTRSMPTPAHIRVFLQSISCPTTRYCLAGGETIRNHVLHPFNERWSAGQWSIVNDGAVDGLSAVSCTSPSGCTGVIGSDDYVGTPDANNQHYVVKSHVERWNGMRWTSQSIPAPAGSIGIAAFGVSCGSSRDCMAVGLTRFDGGPNGLAQAVASQWNGSSWSSQPLPLPAAGQGDSQPTETFLTAISCVASTSCAAVGSYSGTRAGGTLAATWDGSTWTETLLAPSADTLSAVSCSSRRWCMGVGGAISAKYTG
jgi:hypothetical protein